MGKPTNNMTGYVTPGSDESVYTGAALGGDSPQAAFAAEYNALGIKTNLAIPLTQTTSANNAGMRTVVGNNTPQSTPGPVSPSNNIQSSTQMGFLTGTGWWMGFDKGIPKFYVGDYPSRYISWDGDTFTIIGDFIIGNSITVAPGGNIQDAIDTLAPTGGIVYLQAGTYTESADIVVPSGITISGAGIQSTIISFTGNFQIIAKWDGMTELQGINLSGFTVQNSTDNAGIYFEGVQTFSLSFILATNNTNAGIYIAGCELFSIDNVIADSNGGAGFNIVDITSHATQTFSLTNCSALTNTLSGFTFQESHNTIRDFTMVRCQALSNTLSGFYFGSDSTFEADISGCVAQSNGVSGFFINASDCSFSGCQSDSNSSYGFEIKDPVNRLVNCSASSNTTADLYTDKGGAFTNNVFFTSGIEVSGPDPTQMSNNMYQQLSTFRKELTLTNKSGGALVLGNVVVYAPTSGQNAFTTTTSAGDNKVLGIVAGATSVANDADCQILCEGFTDVLKVNGTVDIAVGDWLTTYTDAGIAAKASAGNMAFAIALEAYTGNDSDGVIDAMLFSPRLI